MFCQCGATTALTAERREFFPLADVCAEIDRWLDEGERADVITFAGSGEPTLYSRLGELIAYIKSKTNIPVVLLSNGTLLYRADVRAESARADVVKISLSAWDEVSFRRINAPAAEISFAQFMVGAQAFRREFTGELRLEVFLMDGVNAAPAQVEQIAAAAAKLCPNRIQLNTAVRPVADAAARAVDENTLKQFCELFTPRAEVIASFNSPVSAEQKIRLEASSTILLELIRRHPSTAAQLASITGASADGIEETLAPLVTAGELFITNRNGETYYSA